MRGPAPAARASCWYWSGVHGGDRIAWRRHGRIGDGRGPAVALTDEGLVILVYGGDGFDVTCRLGQLDDDGEVAWAPPQRAAVRGARGQAEPAARLLDDGGFRLSYETGYGRRAVRGTLSSGGVQWDAEAQPASGEDAQFHPAHAIRGGHEVSVVAVPRGNEETEQLVYGTEATPTAAISYEQLAFVEAQGCRRWDRRTRLARSSAWSPPRRRRTASRSGPASGGRPGGSCGVGVCRGARQVAGRPELPRRRRPARRLVPPIPPGQGKRRRSPARAG